jgi:transcriptional regulator with XRE-family HTH domain
MARQGRLRARASLVATRNDGTRTSRYGDTHVVYPQGVSEPKVDREAWATVVARLINEEAAGNKSAFARLIGVASVKTVDRWLARSVNVSEESVRQVARALRLPVTDLLVLVGLLHPDDLTARPAAAVGEDEAAIRLIQQSDAPPALKRELIDHLLEQRAQHEQQRLAEAERMLELALRGRKRAV